MKNITLDGLAEMVAKGFEHTATKSDVERLDKRMANLEEGQEEIKLKLDSVAYRFELVELQRRVDLLEKRAGIRR